MVNVSQVSGEDFTALDPLEVVFMADMVSNRTTVCTTISIVDDMALEGLHSFTVSIVGSDPPLTTNDALVEVTIEDNDSECYLTGFRFCVAVCTEHSNPNVALYSSFSS